MRSVTLTFLALSLAGCATTSRTQVTPWFRVVVETPWCIDSGCIPERWAERKEGSRYETIKAPQGSGGGYAFALPGGEKVIWNATMSEHAEYLMVRRTGPTTPIACVGELRASRDGHELVCFETRALPTGATLKRFDAEARQLSQHEIGVQADRDPERWSARLIGFTTAGLAYSVLSWKGRSEDIRCLAFIVDRTGVARLVASFDLPSMPTTISEQQHACNSDLIRNVYGEIVDEGIY